MILLDFPPEKATQKFKAPTYHPWLQGLAWRLVGYLKIATPQMTLVFCLEKTLCFWGGWKRFPSKIEVIEVIRGFQEYKKYHVHLFQNLTNVSPENNESFKKVMFFSSFSRPWISGGQTAVGFSLSFQPWLLVPPATNYRFITVPIKWVKKRWLFS